MSLKDRGSKLVRNVKELKEQASRLGKEALKTAGTVKETVRAGVDTSKQTLQKAGGLIDRGKVAKGIEITSKGARAVAKGAKFASKGAATLGNTIEKASEQIDRLSEKLKK